MNQTIEEPKEIHLNENAKDRDANNSYITKNTNAQTIANIKEAVASVIKEDGPMDENTDEFKNFMSPTYNVKRIHLDLLRPNNTNFNVIAVHEMKMLYRSIRAMGYVMPVLACFRNEKCEKMYEVIPDKYFESPEALKSYLEGLRNGNTPEKGEMTEEIMNYIIDYLDNYDGLAEDGMPNRFFIRVIDGHHRLSILAYCEDLYKRERGCVPCAMVFGLDYAEKLSYAIVMNHAKGSSQLENMSEIVAELVSLGKSNNWISKKVGLSIDEITRLKVTTGIASLFQDQDFANSWAIVDTTEEDSHDNAIMQ